MTLLALRFRRRAGAMLGVACLALLFCSTAQADRSVRRNVRQRPVASTRTKAPAATVVTTSAPTALTPGMVVSIDPESGRLVVPTAEEMAQLSAAGMAQLSAAERTGLLRTSAGLTEIRGPGNAVGVDLQGRFMEFAVVRLDLQGRLHFMSVDEAPALLRLLDPRTPAPTSALEEK